MTWNGPVIVTALVVAGALFAILTLEHRQDAVSGVLGFVATGIALFTRATKKTPDEPDAGGSSGAPSRGFAADSSIVDQNEAALKLKRELLIAWASGGKDIDDATEFQAEMVAHEVTTRGAKWRSYDETKPPTAADQTVKASEKTT